MANRLDISFSSAMYTNQLSLLEKVRNGESFVVRAAALARQRGRGQGKLVEMEMKIGARDPRGECIP